MALSIVAISFNFLFCVQATLCGCHHHHIMFAVIAIIALSSLLGLTHFLFFELGIYESTRA